MAEFTTKRWGFYTIRKRSRVKTGGPTGLRTGWTEYQVWAGRSIIARHDNLWAAERDCAARTNAFWDEQAAQLRQLRKEARTILDG